MAREVLRKKPRICDRGPWLTLALGIGATTAHLQRRQCCPSSAPSHRRFISRSASAGNSGRVSGRRCFLSGISTISRNKVPLMWKCAPRTMPVLIWRLRAFPSGWTEKIATFNYFCDVRRANPLPERAFTADEDKPGHSPGRLSSVSASGRTNLHADAAAVGKPIRGLTACQLLLSA